MDKFPKSSRMDKIPRNIQRELPHILGRLGLPEETKPLYVGTQNGSGNREPSVDSSLGSSEPLTEEEQRLLEES